MISVNGTVDTNKQGATNIELVITDETLITMDVFNKSGEHNNSRMTLQFSPDNGINWITGDQFTNGNGSVTFHRATTKVRAFVSKPEGNVAGGSVFITAK